MDLNGRKMAPEFLIYLLENKALEMEFVLKNIKRFQQHEILQDRPVFGEYHHLFPLLRQHPEKFYQYTRMEVSTFDYILEKVTPVCQKNWCNLHQSPIRAEERLVVTLRILATGSSYRSIEFSYRIGKSTVCDIFREMIVLIWNTLFENHMPVPTSDMFRNIAVDFFRATKFPHCLGAIDGKHVRIRCPSKSVAKYFNYKRFFSIVLRAVATADYKFLAINVGGWGQQSDGGTLAASDFYYFLKNNPLPIPEVDNLPDSDIELSYFFLGDSAYPLMENLMTPYRGTNLPWRHRNFNCRLSSARRVVECTFGILAIKWRILLTTIYQEPETVNNMVKCMCVLHNVIIDFEGAEKSISQICKNNSMQTGVKRPYPNDKQGLGKEVRSEVAKYLTTH